MIDHPNRNITLSSLMGYGYQLTVEQDVSFEIYYFQLISFMATNYTFARDERKDPGDREAPLRIQIQKSGMKLFHPTNKVTFHERGEDQQTWSVLPSEQAYERQKYIVGLAINHNQTTDSSTAFGMAFHWGVYICPFDRQNEVCCHKDCISEGFNHKYCRSIHIGYLG